MNKFLFLSIVLIIYFLLHYFVYIRIIKGLKLSSLTCTIIKIFFFIAGISFFLDRFLRHHNISLNPVSYFASLWLGIISTAFSLFILQSVLACFFPRKKKLLTIITIVLIICLSCFCLFNAQVIQIKEIHIPIENLPPELNGFSIVQLSDLHLDALKSLKWFHSIMEKVNNLNPDLVIITGDLLDARCDGLDKFSEPLRQLQPPHGIMAVTGNHEYYTGINKFLAFAKKSNIIVLRNSSKTIANAIQFVGINDNTGKSFSEEGSNLISAMKNCNLSKPIILLSHQPKYFKKASEMGVDLQLSGHTHAGQIPPMDLIVHLLYEYPYGLYKYNSSYIYTSCGTSTWGPPMRLFSRSEIVKIILIK